MIRISKILVILGVLLDFASLGVVINNNYNDNYARKESSKIIEELEKQDNKEILDNVAVIDGYEIMGTINIPSLDIKLPIMDRFDYKRLSKAPCLYYGSLETNDAVICSHGYSSLFGSLYKLESKDEIIITDINGKEYHYEVVLVEELKQTDITKMLDNEFDLTLFTCTKDGNNRVTIRCNRID